VASLGVSGTTLFAGTVWRRPSGIPGIFRSTNNGASWIAVGLIDTIVTSFAVSDSNVFVGYQNPRASPIRLGGGVCLSIDGGISWTPVNNGRLNSAVYSLAAKGMNLFASTLTVGVYQSINNGSSWTSVTSRYWTLAAQSLAVNDSNLFLGTFTGGVWSIPLSQLVGGVINGAKTFPSNVFLEQNYPNPFNPTTTIRYGLPRASNVSLAVYNTLGQLVRTLVSGGEQAGDHEVEFDGSGLASGVYFYRIQAGSFVKTMKMLVLH